MLALWLAALLHVLVILGLIRAFTPEFGQSLARSALAAFALAPLPPKPAAKPAGASGAAGKKAVPRPIAAPHARVSLAPKPAPPVAGAGADNSAGTRAAGDAAGGASAGAGAGQGTGGEGQGGGSKVQKLSGEINSARDYPIASRDLRIDDYVVVAITVSAEGRATACRIHRPSRDAEANAITCRLAMERFHFRPATDAAGNPVEATFGWQQKWHY